MTAPTCRTRRPGGPRPRRAGPSGATWHDLRAKGDPTRRGAAHREDVEEMVDPLSATPPDGSAGEELGRTVEAAAERLVGRLVVSVGTDLVDIDEIRTVLARQPRFAHRVFTARERAYCQIPDDPAERFAARFAAKEAVLKALGVGIEGAALTDIEVVRLDSGRPRLELTGRAAARAEAAGIRSWLLTMSHSRHLAHAFVAGLAECSHPKACGSRTDDTNTPSA
ncbi:holo-ACP synthase [Streptomyces sp. NPDC000410]|uniref:holo-ACP synthase n=1 Tax=Streptomyces sp. NPDC000410 TaxID=3154254 RepID=UPI00331855F1